MELKATIVPTGVDIQPHPTNSDVVVFTFDDGVQGAQIVIARNQLPQFVSEVQRQTRVGPSEVIDPAKLATGDIVQPIGHEFRRLPDGHVSLVFYLQTDEGARSVPLSLTPNSAKELADYILATA